MKPCCYITYNKGTAVGSTEDACILAQAIIEACDKARAANECEGCLAKMPAAADGPQILGPS